MSSPPAAAFYYDDRAGGTMWFESFVRHTAEQFEVRLWPRGSAFPVGNGVRAVVDLGGWADGDALESARTAGVEFWQIMGYGLDHIDTLFADKIGLVIARTPGTTTAIALAEHAVLMMLAVAKNLTQAQENLRSSRFFEPIGTELHGKTLGLLGLGASGLELARRAAALGMIVIGVDTRIVSVQEAREHGLSRVGRLNDRDAIVSECDYLSLHLPLLPQTIRTIDARTFSLMQPSAALVNVARGALVDEPALIEALTSGVIAGAGLDVYSDEPLPQSSPLFNLPNVVMTCHIAGNTAEVVTRRVAFCADNVARFLNNERPLELVQ